MIKKVFINNLLKKELIDSMGCTEPSAIAYAVSYAKEQIPDNEVIRKIDLKASSNILKNALCVTLPNTNINGIKMIVLLSLVNCKSSDKLTILNNISPEDIENANNLKKIIDISISLQENVNPLFIEVTALTNNHTIVVIVEQFHDRIKYCSIDGNVIINNDYESFLNNNDTDFYFNDIYSIVKHKEYDLDLINRVKKYNYEIGKYGLKHNVGLNIGSSVLKYGIYDEKIKNVIATTIAGIDSRMGGVPKKVIINSGSGNQGITATVPIVEFARQYGISEDKELDALALSHLVTIYIRSRQDRLSSSCGAICASAGVSAGIAYMLGCTKEQIEGAISNLLCSNFGVFCDGAKATCSFKVASAVSVAINSAFLAQKNVYIKNSYGVISSSLDDTLITLGIIENKLTKELDKTIMNEVIKVNGK